MEKALGSLDRDFAKLRTTAAPQQPLVDGIKADYYGTMTPIGQMASVAVPDSRTPDHPALGQGGMAAVEVGHSQVRSRRPTPINDGKIIRIAIPPLTFRGKAQGTRQGCPQIRGGSQELRVRGVRRIATIPSRRLKKDKEITEDELKKATDDVQKLTDKFVGRWTKALPGKGKRKSWISSMERIPG